MSETTGRAGRRRAGRVLSRRAWLPAAVAATLALTACGADDGGSASSPASSGPGIELPGAPQDALEANAAQANQIVGEGTEDLRTRLADLKGKPVVVNQWASWCPPCRDEFPFFAELTAKYQDRVAFLGLDAADEREAAEALLAKLPPGFPSIADPDFEATRSLGGGRSSPMTFLLDTRGEKVDQRIGAYAEAAELEQDIKELLARG